MALRRLLKHAPRVDLADSDRDRGRRLRTLSSSPCAAIHGIEAAIDVYRDAFDDLLDLLRRPHVLNVLSEGDFHIIDRDVERVSATAGDLVVWFETVEEALDCS